MDRELYQKAVEMIPDVVAKLLVHEGIRALAYVETVKGYSQTGTLYSIDHFHISETELLNHIAQAKKQSDCTIEVLDTKVTVSRSLPDGRTLVAEYRPADIEGAERGF